MPVKLRQYNKVTAAVVAGAVVTLISAVVSLDPTVQDAIQTLLTALAVWAIPNAA